MNKLIYCFLFILTISINAQWMEQSSGLTTSLNSVSAVTDNIAWICGDDGKVIRTNNSGLNWMTATGTGIPGTLDLYNIFALDSTTALVTGSSSSAAFVYRTTNGGLTWVQTFTQTTGFIDAIWMTSAATGVMYGDPVGGRWSIWRTTNGGVNWDSTGMYLQQAGSEAGYNNAMYVSGTNIWFGTGNSRIYYSPLAGLTGTWQVQSTPEANSLSIWFNTTLTGMSGGAQLMKTSNSGANWTAFSGPGTGSVNGVTGYGTNWWYTRQTTSIYISTDNGSSFTSDYTAPNGTFMHIQRSMTGTRLWAARNNGGIASSDGLIGIMPISNEIPSSFDLTQNFPNPFNPVTNFNFSLPKSAVVSIKIYDVAGRLVDIIANNETRSAGKYIVNYSAEKLSSGVYFYTLTANEFTMTKKMVLAK